MKRSTRMLLYMYIYIYIYTGFVRPRENPGISFDPGKTLENPGISSGYPGKPGNFIYLIFVYIFDHAESCMKYETICAKPHYVHYEFSSGAAHLPLADPFLAAVSQHRSMWRKTPMHACLYGLIGCREIPMRSTEMIQRTSQFIFFRFA